METIVQQINVTPENAKYISSGYLDEKIIMNIRMTVSLYEYIETQVHFYDGDDPTFNNWLDVEGFGYGWLWLKYADEEWRWRQMMIDHLNLHLKILEETSQFKGAGYVVYEENNERVYHIITFSDFREDYVFRFSNSELYY